MLEWWESGGSGDRVPLSALFLGFLKVSLCGFGGGLIWARRVVVEQWQWMDEQKFAETLTLCQLMPGPTQTVIPTMFGPGISWQRVRVSANFCSSIHCHCSTTTRRAQMRPPPKPHSETLRKPRKRALSGTRSPE